MSRTKEWMKFGSLMAVTFVLAVAFASVIDWPSQSEAQQPAVSPLASQPAPVSASQPVVDLSNAFVASSHAVRPAVVFITMEGTRAAPQGHPDIPAPFDRFFQIPDQQGQQPRPVRGQGSGFIISPDGYIMTNNHVVEDADRLTVRLLDGREFSAKVIGSDPNTDVAIIKIDEDHLPSVTFGNSDSLQIGQWVLAIGNPLGDQFSFTVTAGIVSGRGRRLDGLNPNNQWAISDFIQTDAAINPGNSGGPLININGQVVGMNSAIASQTGYYSGYSFAIPINLARIVADQLIRSGHVTRAALGVTVGPATATDAEYVGLSEVRGVTVQDFSTDHSPAKRAGLEPGDVIIEVDGQRVDYVAQLQQIVGFKRPGERVRVTVARAGGERKTYTVQLEESQPEETTQVASTRSGGSDDSASYEAKLGIHVEDMPDRIVQDSRIGTDFQGPVISRVDAAGPARNVLAASSPQQGLLWIITHVDGQRVKTVEEFSDAISGIDAGSIVSLRVRVIQGDQVLSRIVRMRTGGN